jgi:hypothetical protein
VRFGLKISIITIKTNTHKTAIKFATNASTFFGWLLFVLHVCCKWSRPPFIRDNPFVRDNEQRWLLFIVVFGGKTGCRWPWISPGLESEIIVVFPPSVSVPSWLLHPSVNPRPLDCSLNRFEPVGGQSSHSSPLPKTSSAEEQLQPNITPSSCWHGGYFLAPRQDWRPRWLWRRGKASAMMLDVSCGHRPMIRRPSDMVSVVDRWLMDVFVVICAWKSTVQYIWV